MKNKAYPKYKDSGVEWLGEIPEHWDIKRLKYIVSYNDESLSETTLPEMKINYVDISSVDLINGIGHIEEYEFDQAPSRARRIVHNGDSIVSTVRTYLKAIAYIENKIDNTIVSTGFIVIRPRKLHSKFLAWYLQSEGFIGEIVSKSVGVSYPAINAPEVVNIVGLIPDFDEQQSIAIYLDKKTAQLDELIDKKKKLIEKLDEKRTALITHAVTKGLDDTVKLKPSGIDWLGDIPEHWETKRLRFIAKKVATGATPSSDKYDYFAEGSIPWFTPGDFGESSSCLNVANKLVHTEAIKNKECKMYPANSILVVGIGATLGKVGYCESEFSANQQINIIIPKETMKCRYLTYFLSVMREVMKIISNATTLGIMNQDKTKLIPCLVPNSDEQDAIVRFLDNEISQIDSLKENIQRAIEKLEEYRSSLITNAVTGKIDVRGVVDVK
jgi:type I restriction enzyme S subunit